MEESKELAINNEPGKNQQKRCRCGSIKHSRVTSKDCPVGLAIRKAKNWPWGWRYLNPEQGRHQNMQQQSKRENGWQQRPLGGEKYRMRGNQQEVWYKIWMLRQ